MARRATASRRAASTAASTRVVDVMNPEPVTVRPDLELDSLRELFLRRRLSRAPVVDELGRAIGMVSLTDLVEEEHERSGEPQGELDRDERSSLPPGLHIQSQGKTVGEIMSRSVLSLSETASVGQAAETLVANHLHGVPVCKESGVVIGFLSSTDLLAWLAGVR